MTTHRYDAAIEALESLSAELFDEDNEEVGLGVDAATDHLRSLRDKPEERPQQPAALPPEVVERYLTEVNRLRDKPRFTDGPALAQALSVIAEHLQSAEARERVRRLLEPEATDWTSDELESRVDTVLAAVVGKGGG